MSINLYVCICGNPKTRKNVHDSPLRPIVSQIGTVTYQTAKWLNSIITKYMNKRYMIESTHEFITISKSIENPKMLASLDVESLFTNIPVNETIDIIIHEVYNHPDIAPPNMPKESLKNLLYICTTKTPFKSPKGHLYQQIDGVSMGTPLGPTLANFYTSFVENKVFDNNPSLKPKVYCRYVDDTFVVINNYHELERLQSEFEKKTPC